jgi:hypothetical protein
MQMNMLNGSKLGAMGLLGLLTIACGDDDGASASAGATEGTVDTETADDGEAEASASASASASEGTGSTTSSADDGNDDDADDGDTDDSGSTSGATNGSDDSTGDGSAGDNGDADPTGNDDGVMEICEAPGNVQPCDHDTTDPFRAIGLGCEGPADEVIPIFNESFTSADPDAWKVARQYGTYVDPITNEPIWSPKEGEQFLMISSGRIGDPDENGIITMTSPNSTTNSNPNGPLPAPMVAAHGSNNGAGGTPFVACDGLGDCSDSLQGQWTQGGSLARDLLWFQFELEVPGGTHGFTFDFAYFSREFPVFIGGTFNDMFVVWSNSESYTGNLCFVDDAPCTVTGLGVSSANPQQTYTSNAPELAGTGFEPNGATAWFEAKASAVPGETLQLTWAVFDMGDTIYDTTVIIDNFGWDCEGCVPSEVNPCGIRPIPM